jgi:hypothetical protein
MLRQRFGGEEGYFEDPFRGEKHLISLKPYAHYADDTRLVISFRFKPDPDFVAANPDLFPTAPNDLQPDPAMSSDVQHIQGRNC